ncbi:MAG: hypothetical protein OMM_05678 [Candidatus Magnetoglobus multicellularis str. Araruama]|uniref:Uncharacterized protein n=1 Tax=Candidatus Magnetoglobus multicellularis str. Araruama TaxID=890399 RepID=A0A1V1NV01_9BACT|nr:MAG: hypothetical protein OMM_05678 [Candidatus Magnetoglobus multicellularis str. Araruama]
MSINKNFTTNPTTILTYKASNDIINKTFIANDARVLQIIFDIFLELIAFGVRNNIDIAIQTAMNLVSSLAMECEINNNISIDLTQDKIANINNDIDFDIQLNVSKEINFSIVNEINLSFNKTVLLGQLDDLTLGELDQYTIGFNAEVDDISDYDGLTLGEIDALLLGNMDNSSTSIEGITTSLDLICEKKIEGTNLATDISMTNNLILIRLGKLSDYDASTLGSLDGLTLANMDETII